MKRLRLMLDAAWPTLLVGLIVVGFGFWRDAAWPDVWVVEARQPTDAELALIKSGTLPPGLGMLDFLIFTAAIAFLSIKSTTILRRMQGVDYLGLSLVAANIAFALLYLAVLAGVLWPYWFAAHPNDVEWLRRGLRGLLVVALAWSTWQVVNVPPPEDEG